MRRARAPFLFACGAATLATLGAIASCGARTGLPTETLEDAGHDVYVLIDHVLPTEDAPPMIDQFQNDVPIVNPCPDAEATLIYVIGLSNILYSYQPPSGPFTPIGTISCPTKNSGDTPFSMAVDREGTAYVVFSSKAFTATGLFRVSTKTAECKPTAYDPDQNGDETFGMGFVANVGDSGDAGETLYVSQDVGESLGSDGALATIDTHTFVLKNIGSFNPPVPAAELTGTGAGRLFAFSPSTMPSDSFIAEIDPKTANVVGEDPTPGVVQGQGWAFGFWGGDFYTFTTPGMGEFTSVVHQFDPVAKTVTLVATAPMNDTIVGAGVSTCAPQN